jgi:hypothetical protein
MRKLKSGEYLVEDAVCNVLVSLWDFLEARGWTEDHAYWEPAKVIIEEMRNRKTLTEHDINVIIRWRGPLGTKLADPDRGRAYMHFIKRWNDMKHYKDHPEVLKKGYRIRCANCREFSICHEPEKGHDPKNCIYFEPK